MTKSRRLTLIIKIINQVKLLGASHPVYALIMQLLTDTQQDDSNHPC